MTLPATHREPIAASFVAFGEDYYRFVFVYYLYAKNSVSSSSSSINNINEKEAKPQ